MPPFERRPSSAGKSESMHILPVNQSAGPTAEGAVPTRVIFIQSFQDPK